MADDDGQSATMTATSGPPDPFGSGYSSVIRGGSDTPSIGMADSDRAAPGGMDFGQLLEAQQHAQAAMDGREFEQHFTPAQNQQINEINNQKATISSAMLDGRIRPQDAQAAIQRLDQQFHAIASSPMQIPKVKPPSMQEMIAQHSYTDQQGNTWFRQQDGTLELRQPSANSPQAKHFDALHEAQMAGAKQFHDDRSQARDNLHDAQGNVLDANGQPALVPHQVAQEQAKAQGLIDKNNAAAAKQRADFEKQEGERARKEHEAGEARSKQWLDEARKELEGKKVDNPNAPNYGAKIPYEEKDVIALAHQRADAFEQFHKERQAKQTPTLAPPQAPEPESPTADAAPLKHPLVRPEAPPAIHQARQQIDDMALQYGGDPTKWPPEALQKARELKQQVLPWRK